MIDKSKLKELALAAMEWRGQFIGQLQAATTPAAILEILEENEKLERNLVQRTAEYEEAHADRLRFACNRLATTTSTEPKGDGITDDTEAIQRLNGPKGRDSHVMPPFAAPAGQQDAAMEALRPFAELAELFDPENRGANMPGKDSDPIMQWPRLNKEYELTVGHLRAARDVLASRGAAQGRITSDNGGASPAPSAKQEPIPQGAARSNDGTTYHGIAEIYHRFEEGEAAHKSLDDAGVPRADESGKVFSLWGRICRFAPVAGSQQVPGQQFTEAQLVAGARALADQHAAVCNVNKEDNWKFHGEAFLSDAHTVLSVALAAAAPAVPVPAEQKPDVAAMVNRFLGWKLPADFSPDCGISFKRESDYDHPQFGRTKFEPIGTNLFSADQAKAMFEYVLAAPSLQQGKEGAAS